MSNVIERMSFIVPIISISFMLIITLINLYLKIRKLFPIRVNCWFCNVNASVSFSQFNSWTCRSCEQYNGFDTDGNYNCDIPSQRSIQLNKRWKTGEIDKHFSYNASNSQRNRLCENCNRNQEIKVQQLASFEPNVKENFDKEIENFREKLEKSYQLCYTCERVVKKTLRQVMHTVLGLKLAQIGERGLQVLDRQLNSSDSKKYTISNRFCLTAVTVLSVWNLYSSSGCVHLSKKDFDAYLPPFATHFMFTVFALVSAVKLLVMEYSSAILVSTIDFNRIDFDVVRLASETEFEFIMNLAAVLLSLKLVLANGSKRLCSVLLMFLWNVNMLWPSIAENVASDLVGILLKIFFGITILVIVTILNCTHIQEATPKCQPADNSFHRIYSNCDEDLSEDSDGEKEVDNNNSWSSTTSHRDYNLTHLRNSFKTAKSFSTNVSKSQSYEYLSKDLSRPFRNDNQHLACPEQYNQDLSMNDTTASRLHCSPFRIPDDCQNKLTDLNISGVSRSNDRAIICSTPTSSIVSLNRCRSQLLTPARLNLNNLSPVTATKTSWVAGGFFVKNNLSPQKRQQPPNVFLHPLSRTSSQSSGFESRASSTHNGCTNGSRESSIAGDVTSNFSEPTFIANTQLSNKCVMNANFSLAPKNQTIFANDSTSCEPESERKCYMTNYADDRKLPSLPISSEPVYYQFGTHRHNSYINDSVFNKFFHDSRNTRKENFVKNDSSILSDEKFF